jgi:hypothetical protein
VRLRVNGVVTKNMCLFRHRIYVHMSKICYYSCRPIGTPVYTYTQRYTVTYRLQEHSGTRWYIINLKLNHVLVLSSLSRADILGFNVEVYGYRRVKSSTPSDCDVSARAACRKSREGVDQPIGSWRSRF